MNNADEIKVNEPITADWLKKNTRIGGWLAFFMFVLVTSGLRSLDAAVKAINVTDYYGSNILAKTDVVVGYVMLAIAIWAMSSFFRRSPAAVFWAKFYLILCVLTNIVGLVLSQGEGGEVSKEYGQIIGGTFWSIIWFTYLHVSERVATVIPKQYRRVGFMTWFVAVLLVLLPFVWIVTGMFHVIRSYHGKVEIRQTELSEGEFTDGHVVFRLSEDWSFGSETNEGVVVCNLINSDQSVVALASELYFDDSKENFEQIVLSSRNEDFAKLPQSTVVDNIFDINGHKCYYRVMKYENADSVPFYRHCAVMFDSSTGKMVLLNGYIRDANEKVMKELLQSIKFHR